VNFDERWGTRCVTMPLELTVCGCILHLTAVSLTVAEKVFYHQELFSFIQKRARKRVKCEHGIINPYFTEDKHGTHDS
jgi:hypothetical protein